MDGGHNRPFQADVFDPDGSRHNVRIVRKLQIGNDKEILFDARGRTYRQRPCGGLGLEACEYTAPDGEAA